jgi:hypothetical protein
MRGLAALLVIAAAAHAQIVKAPVASAALSAGTAPGVRIAPSSLNTLERRFNNTLATLFPPTDQPQLDLLGNTRGVYLNGYGVVFTAEISLMVTPTTNPFRKTIPPELAASVHKKKVERLPVLETAMKQMLKEMATTFTDVPDNQQMVLVVRFYYEPWEDLRGMPSQVVAQADRKSALAGAVRLEEE